LQKGVFFSSTQLKNGGEDLCGEEESMRMRAGEQGMLTKEGIGWKRTPQWSKEAKEFGFYTNSLSVTQI
jgi:hypothetical protein